MSAAEFGTQNLFRPLSQIRVGLEGRKEREIAAQFIALCKPVADQFQSWLDLGLWKLIHQVMKFVAHRAHGLTLWEAGLRGLSLHQAIARIEERLVQPLTEDGKERAGRGA
jgi:hypothetical protein